MPGTGTPDPSIAHPGAHHAGWLHFLWKLLLATFIFLLMFVGGPLVSILVLPSFVTLLLVWGGLVVGISASNLYEGTYSLKWAWIALVVGAYLALSLPEIVRQPQEPSKLVDVLGPVAALTLSAQLARRDLPRALRDWAIGMGLALYVALGMIAMWSVVISFGRDAPLVFLVAILLPPLIFEAVLLALHKVSSLAENFAAHVIALAVSTALAMVVFSFTLLNRSTSLLWSVVFGALAGLLIGGALLVAFSTRPMVQAASGAGEALAGGMDPSVLRFLASPIQANSGSGQALRRALVELSHGPLLISLAVYLPLRLFGMVS